MVCNRNRNRHEFLLQILENVEEAAPLKFTSFLIIDYKNFKTVTVTIIFHVI